jgi:hypothetical protein
MYKFLGMPGDQSYDLELQRQWCKKFTTPRVSKCVLKTKKVIYNVKCLSLEHRWR